MPLPIDKLEQAANEKLELVLTWSNERLLEIMDDLISYQEKLEGEDINFDVLIRKDEQPNQYRVVVYVSDNTDAMEAFPVMASATLEF